MEMLLLRLPRLTDAAVLLVASSLRKLELSELQEILVVFPSCSIPFSMSLAFSVSRPDETDTSTPPYSVPNALSSFFCSILAGLLRLW